MEERKPDVSLSPPDFHHSMGGNKEIDRKLEETRKEYALEQNITASIAEHDAETPLTVANKTHKSPTDDIQDSAVTFNLTRRLILRQKKISISPKQRKLIDRK